MNKATAILFLLLGVSCFIFSVETGKRMNSLVSYIEKVQVENHEREQKLNQEIRLLKSDLMMYTKLVQGEEL